MLLRSKLLFISLCAALPLLTACHSESSHDAHAEHAAETTKTEAPEVTSTLSESAKVWVISAKSKNDHFDGKLSCQQTPFVGDFQSCQLELLQAGKPVNDALLAIDGGMKAHGHGLPTQPRLISPEDQSGIYKIEGLKFSMTGAWTIGFLVRANGLNDQLIFDFTI